MFYVDVVENGFFYIFDSYYFVKDGGGWVGEFVMFDG